MDSIFRELTRGKALMFIFILGIGGSFQTGFHNTGMSSPSPYIKNFINSSWYERYEEYPPSATVNLIFGVIISTYAVGGLFGAAGVKFATGKFGRKKILIGTCLFSVVGGVIMLTSKNANSFEMIVAARLMNGFGAGLGGSVQQIYLMESSPKQLRSTLMLSNVFFLSLGKLSGQVLGLSVLLGREHLWNILLFAPACLVVVQLLALPFFPEAPRYLLMDGGDIVACRKALQRLWGPGEYQVEIDEMLAERAASKGVQVKSLLEFLQDSGIRSQIITIAIISACIQLSGMSAISTFSFDILNKAAVPVDQIRYITLGFGVSEVLATITSTLIIERSGRKPLLLGGFSIMFTMLLLITIMLNLKNPAPWVAYCTAALFMIFIMCVSGGPSGVYMALINDSFEQSHHPAAMTLSGLQRWGQFAVLGLVFPSINEGLGSYCFLLFACFCLLGALYSFFLVPETKGKSPKEVSQQFKRLAVGGKFFGRNQFMETRL
ncbi:solute carrier family 2 member 9, like 1 [Gadus chalcogrammus]|uniref:solute carrier family 2 member 9, like 1 n=1 Tax=Gadus chalcogrammus TaxID=1042646 RepID=UPI0024C4C65D|nr:solute carrier family 2 member 9, like 1 [Gadus chalcogrammus]